MVNATILKSSPIQVLKLLDSTLNDITWLQWESEVLLRSFPLVTDPIAIDKISAIQVCANNTEKALSSSLLFEKICTSFCNEACVMDVQQQLSIEELAYAAPYILKIGEYIHSNTTIAFSGEVPSYVASTAKVEGFTVVPKELAFAQEMLTHLTSVKPTNSELALVKSLGELSKEDILDPVALGSIAPGGLPQKLIRCSLYDPTQLET